MKQYDLRLAGLTCLLLFASPREARSGGEGQTNPPSADPPVQSGRSGGAAAPT